MSERLRTDLLKIFDGSLGPLIFYLLYRNQYVQVSSETSTLLMLFSFLFSLICLNYSDIYRSFRFTSLKVEIYHLCNGIFFFSIGLTLCIFFTGLDNALSTRLLMMWLIPWGAAILIVRICIRYTLRYLRERGHGAKKVVIAGLNDRGRQFADKLTAHQWTGINILGFFDDHHTNGYGAFKTVGPLRDIRRYVKTHAVDFVYVTLPETELETWRQIMNDLSHTSASVRIVPDFFIFDLIVHGRTCFFDDIPFIRLRNSPIRAVSGFIKNCIDRVASSAALVILAPLFLVVAYLVKKSSPGPVFFKQNRHGMNGDKILVYKFRTMYCNDTCEEEFKQVCEDDPGVTKIGAFLRKTSIDELPQLINVLKGDMSLVGPRPHPVAMNSKYATIVPDYMRRHRVKPGITGLAQVKGYRGETDTYEKIAQRIKYDLQYIREWTLMMDFEILVRTLNVFFGQKNAY